MLINFISFHNFSFPLELHLIHIKKGYDSFDEAVKHEDGGVVVVGFYEACKIYIKIKLHKLFEIIFLIL